ncbi:MAG: hypothetical protein ACI83W_001527 [Marinoscillum sp.]|jgi:hypothetical protein
MEFDELKTDWQSQKAPKIVLEEKKNALLLRLKQFNRRVKITNIFTTFGLTATSIYLIVIWTQIPDRGIFFHGSIASMILLMMVSIVMFWRRLIRWNELDFSLDSNAFIETSLRQLKKSKHLFTSFMPIYNIILYVGLIFYTIDITREGSLWFTLLMIAGNTLFVGLIVFFSVRSKLKKNRETLYPLIAELEEFKKKLHDAD